MTQRSTSCASYPGTSSIRTFEAVSDRSVVGKTQGGWSHRGSARSPLVTVTPVRNCSKGEYGERRPVGGGWERGRAGWKAAVRADPAVGTQKPSPSWAARPGLTPVRGRRETRIPEATARRGRRPGLGERGSGPRLTRRRRDEAACSPSAECPSPWPRRLRGPPQPLVGRARSRGPLASLPSSGSRRRSHARGRPRRPATSGASRPASQRPLRRFPAAG